MLRTVFLSLHLFFFLCSPFWFPLSLHTGFGKGRLSWMDWDCQDSSAQQALGWPQGAGREPLGRTGLLGRRGLGVTDDLLPGTGIWDLQVPRRGCPPAQDLRAAPQGGCSQCRVGSGWGAGGICGGWTWHSFASAFTCPPALLPSRGMERWELGSAAGLVHPPPLPARSQGPRAHAAAPGLGHFPRGAGCRLGTSPPALHFTPGLAK